ncbi:MAG: hypothetical protein IPH77_15840 [Ignavibacteria bacterium]|nr:hypothetical protein [Ignavibacteria bacterium]
MTLPVSGDSRLTVNNLPLTMSAGSTVGVWVYADNSYANNPTNSNSVVKD